LVLIVPSCEFQSDRDVIIGTNSFDVLMKYLDSDDVNIIALTLWRMESIDDDRVPDLFISIWEKDGKYKKYYNADIENNILIKLIVASALIQFGYYYSESCESYILSESTDSRVNVRMKVAEVLASSYSIKGVNALYDFVLNDVDQVSIRAFDSLLVIAKEQRRLLDRDAILLARQYITKVYGNHDFASNKFKIYIENINEHDVEFNDSVSDVFNETENTYKSIKVYPETLRLLKPYADNNDPYAKYVIGIKYLDGDEVGIDQEMGVRLLLEAAKDGYSNAYYELSVRYATGKGVPINHELEIYYRKLLSKAIN
jgi:TPR repeat protein